jgi:hypothetical protein
MRKLRAITGRGKNASGHERRDEMLQWRNRLRRHAQAVRKTAETSFYLEHDETSELIGGKLA